MQQDRKDSKDTKSAKSHFPCLVTGGETRESLKGTLSREEKLHRQARNMFRCLTYDGSHEDFSRLNNFFAFFVEANDLTHHALQAMRIEFAKMMEKACDICLSNALNKNLERQMQVFIDTFIGILPLLSPKSGETLFLPQKKRGGWRKILYQIELIDISVFQLLPDQSRAYAIGLLTEMESALPYLIFSGTTYPTGQGARFNHLAISMPEQSVGEHYYMPAIQDWLERNPNALLRGHSQGGTTSMIVAARFPNLVGDCIAFNPTALHASTLNRFKKSWENASSRPEMHVYLQPGDLFPQIDHGFLKDTRFTEIRDDNAKHGVIASHAKFFSGFPSVSISTIDDPRKYFEKNLMTRHFLTNLKAQGSQFLFLPLYLKMQTGPFFQRMKEIDEIPLPFTPSLFSIATAGEVILDALTGLAVLGTFAVGVDWIELGIKWIFGTVEKPRQPVIAMVGI